MEYDAYDYNIIPSDVSVISQMSSIPQRNYSELPTQLRVIYETRVSPLDLPNGFFQTIPDARQNVHRDVPAIWGWNQLMNNSPYWAYLTVDDLRNDLKSFLRFKKPHRDLRNTLVKVFEVKILRVVQQNRIITDSQIEELLNSENANLGLREGVKLKDYVAERFWNDAVYNIARYVYFAVVNIPMLRNRKRNGINPPWDCRTKPWWTRRIYYNSLITNEFVYRFWTDYMPTRNEFPEWFEFVYDKEVS